MPERRQCRYNPYQLPFDFDQKPTAGQHAHVVREAYIVRAPIDAATYLMNSVFTPFDQFRQEHLYVLLLNTKNRITHDVLVYKGIVNTVLIRAAELYLEAVRVNAPQIVLSHCHPSGDPTASPEDVRVTELAYEAGKLLDIQLLDHIIVGDNCYTSLRERGLGFSQTV